MAANPLVYRWLSVLLCYPEADTFDALPKLQTALNEWPELVAERAGLQALLDHLKRHSLRELQENYVLVFDRNRRHTLYIPEHAYDEDRDRGSAMVGLLEGYCHYGFELGDDELPGYLPALLEFLSHVPPADVQELPGGVVHVIAHIAENLQGYGSSYAAALKATVALSPVAPQSLTELPVRDMDEAIEAPGPDWQGIESLLKSSVQTARFYPKGRHQIKEPRREYL